MEKATIGFLKSVLSSTEIDASEKMILNIILNAKGRNFWEMEQLGEMLGMNRQLISKKIKSLIDKGFIFRTKPKGKRYYLTYATDKAKKQFLPNKKLENGEVMQLFNKVIKGD